MMGLGSALAAAVAVTGLAIATCSLLLTARRSALRLLRPARWIGLVLSVVGMTPGAAPSWAMAAAAVGVGVAVPALTLAPWREPSLRDYAAMRGRTKAGDPLWWPELERQFRRQAAAGEENGRHREPR